jgi:hypothetical protein
MQEIIVYRNPVEAMFWHALQDGQIFPIMVGIAVFFLVFLALNAATMRLNRRLVHHRMSMRAQAWASYAQLSLGAVAGTAVAVHMWI